MRHLSVFCLITCLLTLSLSAQAKTSRPYKNYMQAETVCTTLYYHKNYCEAIRILKMAIKDFPERYDEIIWSLAVNYCLNNQPQEALGAFSRALNKNICIPDPRYYNYWKSLEPFPEFKKMRVRNTELRTMLQQNSRPEFEIKLPRSFDPRKKYPLFIALHGWGGSNSWFRMYWKSKSLETDFIVVFMQSSQVVKTNGYCWDNLNCARREISEMYKHVVRKYPVNTEKIFIGGFSQGGRTSLDLAFGGQIPVHGFVVLCPGGGISEHILRPQKIQQARTNGLRGVILTGEHDGSLAEQNRIAALLKEQKFPFRLIVTPDLYHWFPEDFSRQLDKALEFIAEQQQASKLES